MSNLLNFCFARVIEWGVHSLCCDSKAKAKTKACMLKKRILIHIMGAILCFCDTQKAANFFVSICKQSIFLYDLIG
jgi:hypothetical protein